MSSYWGLSENNRKAKPCRLTAEGRKQLVRENSRCWFGGATQNLCLPPFASWHSWSTIGSFPKSAVPAMT